MIDCGFSEEEILFPVVYGFVDTFDAFINGNKITFILVSRKK